MAGGVDEKPDFIPELLLSFRVLDIAIDNDELDEFMHIDDEKNEEYSEALLEDINTALAAVPSGEDADTDDETAMLVMVNLSPIALYFMALISFITKFSRLKISCCVQSCRNKQGMIMTR